MKVCDRCGNKAKVSLLKIEATEPGEVYDLWNNNFPNGDLCSICLEQLRNLVRSFMSEKLARVKRTCESA